MNAVQYLTDSNGSKTSVVISMDDWKNLSNYINEVKALEEIGNSVKSGLVQARMMESGQLPMSTQTAEDFLNEL